VRAASVDGLSKTCWDRRWHSTDGRRIDASSAVLLSSVLASVDS